MAVKRKRTVTTWSANTIKAWVAEHGLTLAHIALDAGFDRRACAHALYRRHRQGEEALSARMGVPLWELWPDRWSVDGQRIDNRFRSQISPQVDGCDSQKIDLPLTAGRAA